MRRLVIASLGLLALIVLVAWMVLPLFRFPRADALDECRRCPELLALVPDEATLVVVAPRGGTSVFELGRRVVPTSELAKILPAPGLVAVGLGDAPVVAWQGVDGRPGGAAAPSRARGFLVRLAVAVRGGDAMRVTDSGLLVAGDVADSPAWSLSRFERVRARPGHFFARHASPAGQSVGLLGERTLDVATWPDIATVGTPRVARHPEDAALSFAFPDVAGALEPVETFLPVRVSEWSGRGGQVVVYGVEGSGLLPSLRGLVIVEGSLDPAATIDKVVPKVEGATRDTRREIAGVEVARRETLGVVVEAASSDGELAIALDGESMERWLNGARRADEGPSIWSLSADPATLAASLSALVESPGGRLLDRSSRTTLRRLRDGAGLLRNAAAVRSSLVEGADGPEIRSRIIW